MAQAKPKRDNKYYLERLRIEHPDVHADFQAGRFKNVSEALDKAGLRKKRSGFDTLKATWNKATTVERDAFKTFIGCATSAAVGAPVSTSMHVKWPIRVIPPNPGKRQLPPALAASVCEIMTRRSLKNGDVMREIGRNPLDTSLRTAITRGTQLQDSLIEDLEAWAARNKAP